MASKSQELAVSSIFDRLTHLLVSTDRPEGEPGMQALYAKDRWSGALRVAIIAVPSTAIWGALLSSLR